MIGIAHSLEYNCSLHLREVILSPIYSETVEGHWGYKKKKPAAKEKEKMQTKDLEEFTQNISTWNPENPEQLLLPWKNPTPVFLDPQLPGEICPEGHAVQWLLLTPLRVAFFRTDRLCLQCSSHDFCASEGQVLCICVQMTKILWSMFHS